jgi:hypothetical protein
MPRKIKSSEENPRTRLSGDFLRALADDFKQHGAEIIAKMRETHPERYAELCGKLIQTVEPKEGGFKDCNSMQDIGRRLLISVGYAEPDEASIQAAIEANNVFVARLQAIAQASGVNPEVMN